MLAGELCKEGPCGDLRTGFEDTRTGEDNCSVIGGVGKAFGLAMVTTGFDGSSFLDVLAMAALVDPCNNHASASFLLESPFLGLVAVDRPTARLVSSNGRHLKSFL